MIPTLPGYCRLAATGELARRADALWRKLAACVVCPAQCGARRLAGETGRCRIGDRPAVAAYVAHHGEEPCLSGTRGAGNVFLGSCNLRCVYCQNHQISQALGRLVEDEVSLERLGEIYLELQEQGCHVLSVVSPSHVVPHTVRALDHAAARGLRLPLVYNSNGYDAVETLVLLDGIVDIYLPDLKYGSNEAARAYSGVEGYWEAATAAIAEMFRQVGPLALDEDGIARRGLLVRHLVLPEDLAGTARCLSWLRDALGTAVPLSIMAQYYPAHRAGEYAPLARAITAQEYRRAVELALDLGFEELYVQDPEEAAGHYRPDFDRPHPFEG